MVAHRVLAAEGKARGGGDADPSSTTSNAATGRNDPVPSGFGRRGAVCFVAAPRRWIRIASSRRLASGPTASRTRPLIFLEQAPGTRSRPPFWPGRERPAIIPALLPGGIMTRKLAHRCRFQAAAALVVMSAIVTVPA